MQRYLFVIFTILFICVHSVNASPVDTAEVKANLKRTVKVLFNDPDSAIFYTNAIIESDEIETEPLLLSKAYRLQAIAQELFGNYKESMRLYSYGMYYAQLASDTLQIGNIFLGQGIIFQKINDLEQALEYYHEAIGYYERVNHGIGISSARNNMASVYNSLGMFDKSRTILESELKASRERNDLSRISSLLSNIAHTLNGLSKFDSSLIYINEAIKIAKEINDDYALYSDYQTKGANYHRLQRFDSAEVYFQTSVNYYRAQGNMADLDLASTSLGEVLFDKGEFKRALIQLDSGLFAAKFLDKDFNVLKQIARLKGLTFHALNKEDSANLWFEKALAYSDSISTEDVKQTLLALEISAQTSTLNAELEAANKSKIKLESANERQRSWLMGIIILLIVTVVAVVSLFRSKLLKDKFNEVLSERNQELETDLETSKRMLSVLAHDFRSPLASVSMIFDHLTRFQLDAEEREKMTIRARKNLSTTLRNIDQLLFWISRDKKIAKPTDVSIDATLDTVEELHAIELENKNIKIERIGLAGAKVKFDSMHLQIIARNLVHNSIKFLTDGGKISISFQELNGTKTLVFEDNGPGIEPELLNQINNHEFHKVLPKRLTGAGIGLELIFDIVKLNNGKIVMESVIGKGTKAIISLSQH